MACVASCESSARPIPVSHSARDAAPPSIRLECADAVAIAEILNELAEATLGAQEMRDRGQVTFTGWIWSPPSPARYAADSATNSILVLADDVFTRAEVLELMRRLDVHW
jgi:hypothetical protein